MYQTIANPVLAANFKKESEKPAISITKDCLGPFTNENDDIVTFGATFLLPRTVSVCKKEEHRVN